MTSRGIVKVTIEENEYISENKIDIEKRYKSKRNKNGSINNRTKKEQQEAKEIHR